MARFAAKETLESLAVARSFESAATSNTGLTAVQCEAHIRGHRVIAGSWPYLDVRERQLLGGPTRTAGFRHRDRKPKDPQSAELV